jgi:hypothetical protein
MSADDLLVTGRRILSAHPVGALFQHRDAAPDELLWVGPVALTPDDHHLVMLSSRYSRVALAVRDHPNVVWTFTDGEEEVQVTFTGEAMLADTPAAFSRWANFLSQEAKDCLLQYPSHTYGFTAVVTTLETIRVAIPSHGIDVTRHIPPFDHRKRNGAPRDSHRSSHSKAA